MRNGTYIKKKPAVMRMITDSSRDTGRNNPSIIQVDGSFEGMQREINSVCE